jgi:hypothetical protein
MTSDVYVGGEGGYPCRVRHDVTLQNKSQQCFLQNNKTRTLLTAGCVRTGTHELPTHMHDIGHKQIREANWRVALSEKPSLCSLHFKHVYMTTWSHKPEGRGFDS